MIPSIIAALKPLPGNFMAHLSTLPHPPRDFSFIQDKKERRAIEKTVQLVSNLNAWDLFNRQQIRPSNPGLLPIITHLTKKEGHSLPESLHLLTWMHRIRRMDWNDLITFYKEKHEPTSRR